MKIIQEVGTRKTAVARATLRPGTGVIRLNGQVLESLPENMFTSKVMEPILLAGDIPAKVDITVDVHGGGSNSQAEAARLAVAKTLASFDKSLQNVYADYDRNLVVADVRRKESSKPNRQGNARAKRQKSYR
jgi:small subunit ribosomal protein S9